MKLEFLDISESQKALEIADFLYGKASAINGTDLSRDEIVHELHRRNTKKQYCLVNESPRVSWRPFRLSQAAMA